MCYGIPLFSNGKKVLYGVGTNSHSTTAEMQGFKEDDYRKYEYHWWKKEIVDEHYDSYAEKILEKIDKKKADKLVKEFVRKNFNTQEKVAKWLKDVPDEWGHLLTDPKLKGLAKKVNPKLLLYQDKIEEFKKTPIEKYNPYQATKLPTLKKLKSTKLAQVGAQVRAQVRAQVWDQVWAQVRAQVWDQEYATSYWGVKVALNLPIAHWFFDFLKLGVMIVFVQGKVKVFGKKGKYLGEYDEKDLMS